MSESDPPVGYIMDQIGYSATKEVGMNENHCLE
jgi:hypothetical protein